MTTWREQWVGRLITTQVKSRQIWNQIVKVTLLLIAFSSISLHCQIPGDKRNFVYMKTSVSF